MELRPARHLQRRARVMRQYEHRYVIRRLVAPPALPVLVRPGAPDRTEHVAPENPGADALEPLCRDAVVYAGFAAVFPVHAAPCARMEKPLHQLGAPDAERILQILVRAGAVAVDGDCK